MQDIIQRLQRFFSDKGTHDSELEEWIQSSDENRKLAEEVARTQFYKQRIENYQQADEKKAFAEFRRRIATDHQPAASKRFNLLVPIVAAACILIFGCGLFFNVYTSRQATQTIFAHTGPEQQSSVFLPDGSQVILNANSSVRYNEQDFLKDRKVYLCGEAYFNVTKQPGTNFRVVSQQATIQVLGTRFVIRSSENDSCFQAALISGSIVFHAPGTHLQVALKPGEEITYQAHSSNVSINKKADLRAWMSWVNRGLQFHNTSLESIAETLSQRYPYTILFADPAIKSLSFTGDFRQSQSPESILDILRQTGKFNFRIQNDTIILGAP